MLLWLLYVLVAQGLYSVERRARSPRLTLRGIVEDLMLTEQLASCVDAEEVEGTTGDRDTGLCGGGHDSGMVLGVGCSVNGVGIIDRGHRNNSWQQVWTHRGRDST